MTSFTITLANQGGAAFDVDRRKPLLQSLREQGVVDRLTQEVAAHARQLNNGYVILCVARPMSDCTLEVGVESHDKLYRNPLLDPLAPNELKADISTEG